MKTLLVDAICGVGFPSIEIGEHAVKAGAARYKGAIHDDNYMWNRGVLLSEDEDILKQLYEGLREARSAETVIIHAD
jgi:hypothetical protein